MKEFGYFIHNVLVTDINPAAVVKEGTVCERLLSFLRNLFRRSSLSLINHSLPFPSLSFFLFTKILPRSRLLPPRSDE